MKYTWLALAAALSLQSDVQAFVQLPSPKLAVPTSNSLTALHYQQRNPNSRMPEGSFVDNPELERQMRMGNQDAVAQYQQQQQQVVSLSSDVDGRPVSTQQVRRPMPQQPQAQQQMNNMDPRRAVSSNEGHGNGVGGKSYAQSRSGYYGNTSSSSTPLSSNFSPAIKDKRHRQRSTYDFEAPPLSQPGFSSTPLFNGPFFNDPYRQNQNNMGVPPPPQPFAPQGRMMPPPPPLPQSMRNFGNNNGFNPNQYNGPQGPDPRILMLGMPPSFQAPPPPPLDEPKMTASIDNGNRRPSSTQGLFFGSQRESSNAVGGRVVVNSSGQQQQPQNNGMMAALAEELMRRNGNFPPPPQGNGMMPPQQDPYQSLAGGFSPGGFSYSSNRLGRPRPNDYLEVYEPVPRESEFEDEEELQRSDLSSMQNPLALRGGLTRYEPVKDDTTDTSATAETTESQESSTSTSSPSKYQVDDVFTQDTNTPPPPSKYEVDDVFKTNAKQYESTRQAQKEKQQQAAFATSWEEKWDGGAAGAKKSDKVSKDGREDDVIMAMPNGDFQDKDETPPASSSNNNAPKIQQLEMKIEGAVPESMSMDVIEGQEDAGSIMVTELPPMRKVDPQEEAAKYVSAASQPRTKLVPDDTSNSNSNSVDKQTLANQAEELLLKQELQQMERLRKESALKQQGLSPQEIKTVLDRQEREAAAASNNDEEAHVRAAMFDKVQETTSEPQVKPRQETTTAAVLEQREDEEAQLRAQMFASSSTSTREAVTASPAPQTTQVPTPPPVNTNLMDEVTIDLSTGSGTFDAPEDQGAVVVGGGNGYNPESELPTADELIASMNIQQQQDDSSASAAPIPDEMIAMPSGEFQVVDPPTTATQEVETAPQWTDIDLSQLSGEFDDPFKPSQDAVEAETQSRDDANGSSSSTTELDQVITIGGAAFPRIVRKTKNELSEAEQQDSDTESVEIFSMNTEGSGSDEAEDKNDDDDHQAVAADDI